MSLLLALSAALMGQGDIEVTGTKAEDPIVCTRSRVHTVGTRLASKRVCKRKSEWTVEARETRRDLQASDSRRIDPAPVPPPR